MAMPRKGKRLSHLQPSPSKFKLLEREGGFILDCVAVDRIAQDYSRSSPKLGFVIPPYDARQDPHLAAYFATKPVCALFRKKGQVTLQHR
ncbi:uncharacterized protein C17orf98-like [Sphaerodactylus townsendi]|uniref:uncharacterized protein C17orf98-like n=1 Tax=Sphaerodactylus townsendi TaxID=933632 RepID=UPI0020274C73|nr:uncharacterized protein C17orf98-like [Sphaerodactylus townsendi]